ncbi:hypothetical protein A8L34_27770 [Bacillus sp. FJAT-27264]|nr:hypothetical protein A8L34_27770 [Bacillus sp. FJAT-27264]
MIVIIPLFLIMVFVLSLGIPGDGSATPFNPAGFWSGIWHGYYALFFFIWSWFNGKIGIYETYNNGLWYNLGYLISMGAITFNISSTIKKR